MLAAISFPILERIPIFGDVALSPHGVGIAVGFLLGAVLMMRRADKRGIAHFEIPDLREQLQDLLVRGAIGAVIGSRLFWVITHAGEYTDDPLRVFAVWEGGLTFLGGLAGAILLALPVIVRKRWRFFQLFDSVAPGVALGLMIGRLGDLLIGDHIGDAAGDFPLAWRCTSNLWVRATNSFGSVAPESYPLEAVRSGVLDPPTQGCFDVAVHQTALYDFIAVATLLLIMLWAERQPRWDGFFVMLYIYWYGLFRFLTDFVREDQRILGLTGSQWALVTAALALTAWLANRRPWNDRPWAWDPPDFDHPWRGTVAPVGPDADANGEVAEPPGQSD